MMENRRAQKWLMISFFTSISLFFVYFIVFLVMGATDRTYHTRLEPARTGPGSYRQETRINLITGQPVTVEKVELTFRGVSSGEIKMDVILLDLDPQYIYRRSIPIARAKQGFAVSDYRFKATSINNKRLRLVLEN
jgi:hypothetical protein